MTSTIRTDTRVIKVIDGEVAAPGTSEIPTYLGRPMLPEPRPLPRRFSPRRTPLSVRTRSFLTLLLSSLAALAAVVLHPETANPRPHSGYVAGTVMACCLLVAYAIAQMLTGSAR